MCPKLGVKDPNHLISAQSDDGLGTREAQKRRSREFRHGRVLIAEVSRAKTQICKDISERLLWSIMGFRF